MAEKQLNRFAEFPFWMIRSYFEELGSYYQSVQEGSASIELEQASPVVFTDTEEHDWNSENGYLDWNGENSRDASMSRMNNARFAGPGHHIISNGGGWTPLYVEKESYGYREVAVRPQGEGEGIDENWFKFDLVELDKFAAGFGTEDWALKEAYEKTPDAIIESYSNGWTIVKDILTNGTFDAETGDNVQLLPTVKPINISVSQQGKTHAFKVYESKVTEFNEDAQLVPEDIFFLRKDALFFDWYRRNLKFLGTDSTYYGTKNSTLVSTFDQGNHENFLNENLTFTYFGGGQPIHQENSEGQIRHHSMKNFMLDALPPNDLNATNATFIWETMDRVYEEPYNKSREVQTLLDPEEISERMLPLLGSFYDVSTENLQTFADVDVREFVKSLPVLLKKKGTQASLATIGRSIINSKNKVTFYERGHETLANEPITAISLEILEDVGKDPEAVLPGGEDGNQGGGPPAEIDKGFPNPFSYVNYAVLYCFDKQMDVNVEIGRSEVYLFWDNALVNMKANMFHGTIDYLSMEIQRSKTIVENMTYLIGNAMFEMDITAGVSAAAHSNGKIKYFALTRRPKQSSDYTEADGTVKPPKDYVPRFLTNDPKFEKYNTPVMVECRSAGVYTPEEKFFCKIEEIRNSNKVTVTIFWNSYDPIYMYIMDEPGLNHNFIMNHAYLNYFGDSLYSYKLGKMVDTVTTDVSVTTYGEVGKYNRNNDGVNEFTEPEDDNPFAEKLDIMYNYNSPRFFIKLTMNLSTLKDSELQVGGNNINVYTCKAPKELKAYNEIKFGAQNFVVDIKHIDDTHTKYGAWPNFIDCLDNMYGAEMDSRVENGKTSYYYKVRRG